MDNYTIVIVDYSYGPLRFYHFNNEPDDAEDLEEVDDAEAEG